MVALDRTPSVASFCVSLYLPDQYMMNDYHNNFSPLRYLEQGYKTPGESLLHDFAMRQLCTFFSKVKVEPACKVLDYGCGPVIANAISAARVAKELVLAEYTEKNRKTVQQWLHNDPSAWNWKPFFEYIVMTLEGKSENEAKEREHAFRNVVKAVTPCDVTQDPPIAVGYEGPYDVVMCLLSIEAGCLTQEDYKAAVKQIACLVKPEGFLLLYSSIRHDASIPGCYTIGVQTFIEVPLTLEFVYMTLKEANFEVVMIKRWENPEQIHSNLDGAAFIVAKMQ